MWGAIDQILKVGHINLNMRLNALLTIKLDQTNVARIIFIIQLFQTRHLYQLKFNKLKLIKISPVRIRVQENKLYRVNKYE
jgi:hypothetical protein